MNVTDQINAARRLQLTGRLAEAKAIYQNILTLHINNPDALHLLGVIHLQTAEYLTSVDLIRRAITLNPTAPEYFYNLGLAFAAQRHWDNAAAAFARAITLKPHYPTALDNLAAVYKEQDKLPDAIATWRTALQLNPNLPNARRALPAALLTLGDRLEDQRQYDPAAAAYTQALEINPDYLQALNNLAIVHKITGRLDDAMRCYQRALQIDPANAITHSNLIFLMEFLDGLPPAQILEEQQSFERHHTLPLRSQIQPHTNDRHPDRPLRIGYISPDLRDHVVAIHLLPLLSHHNHDHFEIFAYSATEKPDQLTARLRSSCDAWRDISKSTDSETADLIRRDQIDILVDLSLHMADHRLLVLARKPAPLQVTYLGYCGTTGLSAIDYRISDPYLDPPDVSPESSAEKTLRLPRSYWCYQPPNPSPPVSPLPTLTNGYITFGCLNNFTKVSPATQAAWAKILAAVPNSRLILYCPPGAHRPQTMPANPIEFLGKQPHPQYLATYDRIDIALDPFPYAGGITSCDALWMGVPIVTLSGRRPVGRGGHSILSNIGLPQWIARSTDDYLRLAIDLAADLPRLAHLRSTLRHRLLQSPLTDAPGFARDIEALYRRIWTQYCNE